MIKPLINIMGIRINAGKSAKRNAVPIAARVPITYCPSAPILSTRALKGIARPSAIHSNVINRAMVWGSSKIFTHNMSIYNSIGLTPIKKNIIPITTNPLTREIILIPNDLNPLICDVLF